MRAHRFLPLATLLLIACSSADFDVPSGPGDDGGGDDTLGGADSHPIDGEVDSGNNVDGARDSIVSGDSGTGDGTSGDATSGCGTLSSTASAVYVDVAATGASVGTIGCPFHTIHEATVLPWVPSSGHRIIHVAAGTYVESHTNVVSIAVTVAGAGVGVTQVSGGGSCSGGANCVFEVQGGAVLHDLTVMGSASSDGIVTDVPAAGSSPPLVFRVSATGAGGAFAGVLTRGDADIGPNVALTGNGRGIDSIGSGEVHVLSSGATPSFKDNLFSGNAQAGIYMEGNAILVFDAGEVHHNGVGISLIGAAGVHNVSVASIHDNTNDGIAVTGSSSLFVRDSSFAGNTFGIRFVKTATNTLDLGGGATATSGMNTFGGATIRNRVGGVCLNLSLLPTYVVPAEDDAWSTCDPTILAVATCDSSGAYADVYLAPASAAGHPDVVGCAVGP